MNASKLAKAAIDGRLYDLQSDGGHFEERHLMTHALRSLSLLSSSTSDVRFGRDEEEDDEDDNEEPREKDVTSEGYSE